MLKIGGENKMGQHKTNPNSILKSQGKIEPKKKRLSKKERDAILYQSIEDALHKHGIITPPEINSLINSKPY